MTIARIRTPGSNDPETRVYCDGGNHVRGGCWSLPVVDRDAITARLRGESLGWGRAADKDYCPAHLCGNAE